MAGLIRFVLIAQAVRIVVSAARHRVAKPVGQARVYGFSLQCLSLQRPVRDLGIVNQPTKHGDDDNRQQHPEDNGF
ncbi:hypothetical protein ASE98_23915 [Pseudomonas sp. Leaf48]|nr:hypothetical protein ASE98_23915 [Pseudomonas sp. Leaf48]